MASATGVTRQTIDLWLTGKGGKPNIEKIAAAINCSVEEVRDAIMSNGATNNMSKDNVRYSDADFKKLDNQLAELNNMKARPNIENELRRLTTKPKITVLGVDDSEAGYGHFHDMRITQNWKS